MSDINISLDKPIRWQENVLKNKRRYTIINCSRQIGKSTLLLLLAVIYSTKGKSVLVTFPTYKSSNNFYDQLEAKLFPLISSSNKTEKSIKLKSGGSINIFSLDTVNSADSMRGGQYDLYLSDETAYVDNFLDIWNKIIRPMLRIRNGKAVFASTPKGLNDFHKLYLKGLSGDPEWISFRYTIYDSELTDIQEIERIKDDIPDIAFQQEYMCEVISSQTNPFKDNIIKNIIQLSNKPTVAYGVDLASVVDFTCIIGLDEDKKVSYFDCFQDNWNKVTDRIKELGDTIPIVMDGTGVGSVVLDRLKPLMPNLYGYTFTPESKTPLVLRLIKAVEMGEIKFTEEIANEMSVFSFKQTPRGTKYQALPGYNDDKVMALALSLNCFDNYVSFGDYYIMSI